MSNKYDYDSMSDLDILTMIGQEYEKQIDESIEMIKRRDKAIRIAQVAPLIFTSSHAENRERRMYDFEKDTCANDAIDIHDPALFDFIGYEVDEPEEDQWIDITS